MKLHKVCFVILVIVCNGFEVCDEGKICSRAKSEVVQLKVLLVQLQDGQAIGPRRGNSH